MITLDSAQEFSGLKSRIVVFQKQAGKLFMLESQKGHTVMPDTPFAPATDLLMAGMIHPSLRTRFREGSCK